MFQYCEFFPIVPRTLNKQYFYCHFQEHGEDNVGFLYDQQSHHAPNHREAKRRKLLLFHMTYVPTAEEMDLAFLL